jgi:hypothetical protein
MKHPSARSLVLVPSPLAEELLRLAHDWVAAWVADPFLVVVLGDGSVGSQRPVPDVTAQLIGRDGSVSVDLLDELTERPAELLRVVGITVGDGLLGTEGTSIHREATQVERMLRQSASTHNRIVAMNLVVTETGSTRLDAQQLLLAKWDLNVLASPENRTGLESFDAFTRRSRPRDLNGFILAHALTIVGQWSGMTSGPFDSASPRRANDGTDLQRISVRGVLAQDFLVDLAQQVLEMLVQQETPLRDPTIRAQLSEQQARLIPVPDSKVDEAVSLLTAFVLDDVTGQPLRYRPQARIPHSRSKVPAMQAVRSFGRFAFDKVRVLPKWAIYRTRVSLQSRTGRTLHGEDGADLIVTALDPFGDAAEFQRDIEEAVALRERGLAALASPPAVTLDGPDTYANLWSSLREAAFRALDGGAVQRTGALEERLKERRLDGALPDVTLVCPDAREPWSPHSEVAALVEAETRELPLTVGWLDVDEAARWAEVLESLAATYDERVRAVDAARELVERESVDVAESILGKESDLVAIDALLELDEYDRGPILDARIDAALAGISDDIRRRLVPDVEEIRPDDPIPVAPPSGPPVDAGDIEAEEVDAEEVTGDAAEGGEESPADPPPAFDRDAAHAWRILVERELDDLTSRRDNLLEQAEELRGEREMLDEVHPVVTADLLTLRAWRWRLERSFAGRLVHELSGERQRLDADQSALESELRREHPELAPVGSLYSRFVRHLSIGFAVTALLTRLLWEPFLTLIGVRYGDGSALVSRYLGVPAYPFIVLFLLVAIVALLDYHRRWSRQSRALDQLRQELRQLPGAVEHLQRERLRTFELHRQAREMLRLMSEVLHRPFLLDGIADVLPSSRSLDPRDLPKVVRFARPEIDETWTGEIRFIQRILRAQLRPGWRSEAYATLLEFVQNRHGVVRGELDAARVDQDPVVRTAIVEHLLLDDAQREAGIARVRDVVNDILGWSVEPNFPYPKVRVVRVERDPLDVRTDMFDDGKEPAEEWQAFLGADVVADERWSPLTFATGFRKEFLDRRQRIVHAPPRFHGSAGEASVIAPRMEEVRPVEMVVRVDILPEPAATSRMGVFAEALGEDDDRQGDEATGDRSGRADEATNEGASVAGGETSSPGMAAEEEHSFNF